MADGFRQLNKAMFGLLPVTAGLILVVCLSLSLAWVTGYFVSPLRDDIGAALNFTYRSEEIVFFSVGAVGSLVMLGFHRLFRDFVASR